MRSYRRILVAIDFSKLSRVAAERGRIEAGAHAASLGLVHVIEHFPVVVPPHWIAPENVDPATYFQRRAAEELARIAAVLGCEGADQEVVVTETSAGHALAEFAKERQAELIVAGVHGNWALGMLGSTAVALLRQAHCDVLLVR
jgi:nucleotide-binding universal stress UspA family protein